MLCHSSYDFSFEIYVTDFLVPASPPCDWLGIFQYTCQQTKSALTKQPCLALPSRNWFHIKSWAETNPGWYDFTHTSTKTKFLAEYQYIFLFLALMGLKENFSVEQWYLTLTRTELVALIAPTARLQKVNHVSLKNSLDLKHVDVCTLNIARGTTDPGYRVYNLS